MERDDLYEDDLTEEREITPAERDDVAQSETLDPQVNSQDGDDFMRRREFPPNA